MQQSSGSLCNRLTHVCVRHDTKRRFSNKGPRWVRGVIPRRRFKTVCMHAIVNLWAPSTKLLGILQPPDLPGQSPRFLFSRATGASGFPGNFYARLLWSSTDRLQLPSVTFQPLSVPPFPLQVGMQVGQGSARRSFRPSVGRPLAASSLIAGARSSNLAADSKGSLVDTTQKSWVALPMQSALQYHRPRQVMGPDTAPLHWQSASALYYRWTPVRRVCGLVSPPVNKGAGLARIPASRSLL